MNLKDCSVIDVEGFANAHFPEIPNRRNAKINACREWLTELAQEVRANELLLPISLSNKDIEPIVYCDFSGKWWTGRYIGSLEFKGKRVTIEPRFGTEFVAEQFDLSNFALVNLRGKYTSGPNTLQYIQALMWMSLFSKAARHGQPTQKRAEVNNGFTVNGRIDVRGTIANRFRGSEKVTSIRSSKTIYNPATIAIVLSFYKIQTWFPHQALMHWLPEALAERLQQMIAVVGRRESVPSDRSVTKLRYSPLTRQFQPLVKLSMQILNNNGAEFENTSNTSVNGLLLDVAELWERYVNKVLVSLVGDIGAVKHGDANSQAYLLTDSLGQQSMGKLIPDFLVSHGHQLNLVADAKYKRLGDAPWQSPQRDDLYQMTAYLQHYTNSEIAKVNGLLIYPEDTPEGPKSKVEKNGPWRYSNQDSLSFVTIPTRHDAAVAHLKNHSLFATLADQNQKLQNE